MALAQTPASPLQATPPCPLPEGPGQRPCLATIYTGIGSVDYAFERAGWITAWQVECDEYRRRVLTRHWPLVPRYAAVSEIPATVHHPQGLWASTPEPHEPALAPLLGLCARLTPVFVIVETTPGTEWSLRPLHDLGYTEATRTVAYTAMAVTALRLCPGSPRHEPIQTVDHRVRRWLVATREAAGIRAEPLADLLAQTATVTDETRVSIRCDSGPHSTADDYENLLGLPGGWSCAGCSGVCGCEPKARLAAVVDAFQVPPLYRFACRLRLMLLGQPL